VPGADRDAARIVGAYVGVGSAWILASGLVVWRLTRPPVEALVLETGKGLAFVAVTALLLYILVRRAFRDRERLAREAHAAAATTERVIDAVPLVVLGLDAAWAVTGWNAAATAVLGLRAEDRGASLRSLHAGRLVPLADALPHVLAPSAGPVEVEVQGADGHPRSLLLRAATLPDEGLIVVAEELAQRRGIEGRMRQLQRLETVGRVTAGVAHDLNNILTAVLAHAEFQLGDAALGAERREDAAQIRAGVLRAASLTRRLVAFSRQRPTAPADVRVDAVLEGMTDLLCRVTGSSVAVRCALGAAGATARIDPGELEQVVLNLVVNAREAMPEGGRITVSTAPAPPRDRHGPAVLLTVEDEGVGMDTDTLGHVFEPFFTTKEEGTGIGLATVYSIVVAAGGEVAVESTPGRGTRFTLRLPAAPTAAVEGAAAPVPAPSAPAMDLESLRGAHVLVLDDEVPIRTIVTRVLERAGLRVTQAASGEEAVALLDAPGGYDAVLADFTLPGMDGLAVLTDVARRLPGAARLLMSGHQSLGETPLEGITFVPKPFAPVELLAVVRDAMLARRGAHS
jgi:two-component system, cell cycle sensor histidine kinase and response regulator CckA